MKIKHYNLTFLQRIRLMFIYPIWLFSDKSKRKTWHNLKKSIEKHDHNYQIPVHDGYRNVFMCAHEGCMFCSLQKSDITEGFIDWNKLTIDQSIEHLESRFQFDSTGTAKAVFELIAAYRALTTYNVSDVLCHSFEIDNRISSATKCKNCGREKLEHQKHKQP